MKIFLSWSGNKSQKLAEIFNNWLPNVIQSIEPYMSAKDIKLGERWTSDIEKSLNTHDFGLVFVTPENIDAPWINFEAGALSKNLKSRLIPMIFDGDLSILNNGPLKQFQSQKNFDKDSIMDLIQNLNADLDEDYKLTNKRLDASFSKWWPDLKKELDSIRLVEDNDAKENEDNDVEDFEKKALIKILEKIDNLENKSTKNIVNDEHALLFFEELMNDVRTLASLNQRSLNVFRKREADRVVLDDLLGQSYALSQRVNINLYNFLN